MLQKLCPWEFTWKTKSKSNTVLPAIEETFTHCIVPRYAANSCDCSLILFLEDIKEEE